MRKLLSITIAIAVAAGIAVHAQQAQQQPAPAARGGRGPTLFPQPSNEDSPPKIPVGYTSIFNGKDLTGWHISKSNSHGTTPDFKVVHGVVTGTQQPFGQGGILLTDKKYKNVEVYIEVKPDFGCDSGLFLRSSEAGQAYQVMLDYLPGGAVGYIYGEGIQGVNMGPDLTSLSPAERDAYTRRRNEVWQSAWKREEWNSMRARITGNPPHITTWINDQLIFDGTDTANHAANGAEDGSVAIQVHGGARWRPAHYFRWRVIAVKELP